MNEGFLSRHYIPSLYEVLSKFKNINFIIDLKSLPAKKLIDSIAKILNKSNAWNYNEPHKLDQKKHIKENKNNNN